MCPNKELKKEENGYLDLELFKKIIDEIKYFAFEIFLHHRGESLIHPDFFKMVKYAHEAGITVKLHTNGTLLDEKKSYQIIESGLDQLSFSFDGFDKEIYEKIRVGGNFEKVVNNIIQFLKIKKELKAKKPFTIIELINFPHIYSDNSKEKREKFLNRFKGLPLNRVEIREMHNWAGLVEKNQNSKIKTQNSKNYSPCTFLWQALIIFWDGSVVPCTQDFHGYYILGNVKDASIKEIWNNEKMINLRKKMRNKDICDLDTCKNCDRLWREKFLGIPKEYLWKFLLKRMP
ncbi:SPASM domain-containing protein [Candidatus Aminicenantes bacterium AC-708-M15]|jgi:radical SAM protein with 4Fe4S-binding SPASM domain|nr:SPASM domain-containing protein [Candidatus Aminicenantes bacterium AC-708-M15]